MCFGEPARVITIDGTDATVDTLDGPLEVSLVVLTAQHHTVQPGDWVVVSLGLAIDTLDRAEAADLWNQLTELRQLDLLSIPLSETVP